MARLIEDDSASAAREIGRIIRGKKVLVLTGAGVSTESGIPDFRSPGGIWSRMRPIEFGEFIASEDARLEDWRRRFEMAELFTKAAPNAAHQVVARWAHDGVADLVVTQNIDGLHGRAGTPAEKLCEIHGTMSHAACLDCGAHSEIEAARRHIAEHGRAPRCTHCGGLVKAAIVSFGQAMPEWELVRAQSAAEECDVLLAIGTSLVVYPVAALPGIAAAAGAEVVIMSREPTAQDHLADLMIRTPIAETFGRTSAHDH